MAKECAFIAIIESDFGYEFEFELELESELDLQGEEGKWVQGTVLAGWLAACPAARFGLE